MMDHVWLVNAPVSTADARNLLLSLLSGFLSMPSVFLYPNSSKRTLLNRHKCHMSTTNPNFFSKYLNFFFLWGIDLAREHLRICQCTFRGISSSCFIFSPAAVFSMSTLPNLAFERNANPRTNCEPPHCLWQITN